MSWSLVIAVLLSTQVPSPCNSMGFPNGDLHHGLEDVFDRQLPHDSGAFDSFDDVHAGNNWGHTSRAGSDRQGAVGGRAEALKRFAAERAMKTGTTIAGVVFEGGVVLAADTRATGGKTVCDRNCNKIHILASNIACCGAGTSADAVRVTEGVRLALLRMASEMQACLPASSDASPVLAKFDGEKGVSYGKGVAAVQRQHLRVAAAAFMLKRHLFRHQGTVSAALVLGGVDAVGEHLYQIHEGGSFGEVVFTAMGSGSLAALSVLEGGHREGLNEEDAKELVLSAIAAGISNDLGSGSNIDVCVITKDRGLEHHRGAYKDPGVKYDDSQPLTAGDSGLDSAGGDGSVQDQALGPPRGPRSMHETSTTPEQPSTPVVVSAPNVDMDVRTGQSSVEIGGKGGSRAWVGNVQRRGKGKRVVKADEEGGGLRSFRCSALDDKVEVL